MRFNILNVFRLLRIDVSGEIEVIFVFLYFVIADKARIFWYFQFATPCINDLAVVLLTQTVFIAVFYKTLRGINHKDAFTIAGSGFIQNNNAGRNARAIKQVCRKSDDAFDVTTLNNILTDFSFSITTEQNTMGQNNRTGPIAFERLQDMQKKSIVTALLGRNAKAIKAAELIVFRI